MGELNHILQENINALPRVDLFGLLDVSIAIVISWGIMIFLIAGSLLATRNLKQNPGKGQALLELCIDFFNRFCQEHLGRHWRVFAPWLGTVALFILSANLSAVFGIIPPTKDLSVTATLALLSMVLIYGAQLRYLGLKKGLQRFAQPVALLLPINLLEILIRPLSLCMRLFGNILATHLIMEMLKSLVPVILPAIFGLYFDLFDGAIQAVVFVFLTILFVGEAIEDHDDHPDHEATKTI